MTKTDRSKNGRDTGSVKHWCKRTEGHFRTNVRQLDCTRCNKKNEKRPTNDDWCALPIPQLRRSLTSGCFCNKPKRVNQALLSFVIKALGYLSKTRIIVVLITQSHLSPTMDLPEPSLQPSRDSLHHAGRRSLKPQV